MDTPGGESLESGIFLSHRFIFAAFRLMYRTHTCGELRIQDAGKKVTLAGWVQVVRKFGSISFIDLRDRYGITQLLLGEELNTHLEDDPIGREFVLQATGIVSERSNKNPNLPTGDI